MGMFASMYDKTLAWSRHPKAPWFLGGLGFAESSFFPVPPDVMLAPMALAQPKKAWWFALICTVASVLGGMAGYFIGVFAFELIEPVLRDVGYWDNYLQVQEWFDEWGFWAIFLAGFSPIPYKVFTIGAGAISMSFFPFMLASLIGRGGRFFLVAGLMAWGGEKMEKTLREYIDRIGLLVVVLAVVAYFSLRN